jgi:hypothetical protein
MPVYRINGRNVLFIHVLKTGGTSVEKILAAHASAGLHNNGRKLLAPAKASLLESGLAMQHFHADILTKMFPVGYFDYAFMIVRHPANRLVSEYMHWRNYSRVVAAVPFNMWAHNVLRLRLLAPHLSNNHFRAQSDFHCFGAEVFHFEHGLQNILKSVAARLSLPEPDTVPHERKSQALDCPISPGVMQRLKLAYAADYANFGYPMSGAKAKTITLPTPMSQNLFPGHLAVPPAASSGVMASH